MKYANHPLKIALLGQPNVGKSTVFNMLTGLSQHVGNWPGKTVTFKIGSLTLGKHLIQLVDLPGTYSLTANSEEERVARDYIIHEDLDSAIVILNAAALERNLYLVAELLALDVQFVIGLNMMDVADQQGFAIDVDLLEAALGVPVVPLIASKNQGLKELVEAACALAEDPTLFKPNKPKISPKLQPVLDEIRKLIQDHIPSPYHTGWVALKLLEGDREVLEKVREEMPEDWSKIREILMAHEDAILDIASSRYEWIERMVRIAIHRPRPGKIVLTDRLDRAATHPFWGLVILFVVLGLVFYLTYAIATPIVEWLESGVLTPAANFFADLLVNAPAWFSGFFVDGVIGGVGTVLTFLPILVLFFVVLGFLEDVGYLARAAFVMDRFMHWIGLHGRSFLSLFLGFGCNVPAVLGTRIIESNRARLLTILLIPFIPCTARLAVVAFLAPAFFKDLSALVMWLLVVLNLVVLIIVGIIINRFFWKGKQTPFIMEIPLYHLPNARTIGLYVWHNTYAFIKKAGGLIVVFSVVIWFFSWFPSGNINDSLLARFGRLLEPLGNVMGLRDWRLIVALLSSFIAKENTIATLGILFGVREQSLALSTRIANTISPAGAISFLIIQMLFIPCIATVAVIRQEAGSWRFVFHSVILQLLISFSIAVIFYQGMSLLGWGL